MAIYLHGDDVSRDEKIREQRECFAVKACYDMGKTVDETVACLAMNRLQVSSLYNLIRSELIDFDSPFSE